MMFGVFLPVLADIWLGHLSPFIRSDFVGGWGLGVFRGKFFRWLEANVALDVFFHAWQGVKQKLLSKVLVTYVYNIFFNWSERHGIATSLTKQYVCIICIYILCTYNQLPGLCHPKMKWKCNPSSILPAHSLFFGRTGSARPLKRQRAHQILGSSMTSDFSWFFKSYFSWKALVLMDKIYGYWYDHGIQNILIMYVCIYALKLKL